MTLQFKTRHCNGISLCGFDISLQYLHKPKLFLIINLLLSLKLLELQAINHSSFVSITLSWTLALLQSFQAKCVNFQDLQYHAALAFLRCHFIFAALAFLCCHYVFTGSKEVFATVLMDLSKAFDCILDELLLAKLNAYGLDKISLTFMHAYLSQQQHKTKVGSTFRELMGILFGVPQGSILGPLLFIIYNCD